MAGRQMTEDNKRYGLLSELSGIEETWNPDASATCRLERRSAGSQKAGATS